MRARQTVLLVDLVESVRLMSQSEPQTVRRWCELVDWLRAHLIRVGGGRLVKSLGDGLLLVFDSPHTAWQVACSLHQRLAQCQWCVPAAEQLWLRAGLHLDWVYQHPLDVFGTAPNLAARIASLAGAGDTVCTAEVWAQIQHDPNVQGEDWGLCWLKHLQQPVRVWRLHAIELWQVESTPRHMPVADEQPLSPLIALVSAQWISPGGDSELLADLVLHGLAERLTRVHGLRVVDALSAGLPGLGVLQDAQQALRQLKADALLVLGGRVQSERLTLEVEWVSRESMPGNFSVTVQYPLPDVFEPDSALMGHVVEQVVRQLLRRHDYACARLPLHNLGSHALMLAGIQAQHGEHRERFAHARACFEELVRRHPRLPSPRAWLSQWHVLSVTRGLTTPSIAQAREALMQVQQALMHQPDHPLAWAAQAFVQCHLERDPERAHASVMQALRLAPSQAVAWMYRTTIESLLGRTDQAYAAGQRALELTPLGPLRYYQCCLVGHAALFDGRPQEAVRLLEESMALNPSHSPTARMLVVAHHDLGQWDQARRALAALRRLEPALTVETYLARSAGGHAHRARFADAMAAVGLPRS
jgi:class 3 adenylate cyclase/tetratricopeptide (TPR) repeat protein